MQTVTRRKFVILPLVAPIALMFADWKDAALIQPKDLAARLKSDEKNRPLILQVGFMLQYKQKHIPGAIYAGPGNKPEGLEKLKTAVESVPKDREIILYCGCCPWEKCPNMKPAHAWLIDAGHKNVRAMVIEKDFGTNWVDMGYPVE